MGNLRVISLVKIEQVSKIVFLKYFAVEALKIWNVLISFRTASLMHPVRLFDGEITTLSH